MKPQRKYLIVLLVAVLAAGAWFGNSWFEARSSAREAQRLADIAAAKDRAATAEAAADAAEKEADALRLELERRSATIAASGRRIKKHREAPIDYKNIDTRELAHNFALLGYGLPR